MVEELGVARATVREALRFLELQGALRIKAGPGGGPVVSIPGADHLASVPSLHLQFAVASFRSVVEARRFMSLIASASGNPVLAILVDALHRMSGESDDGVRALVLTGAGRTLRRGLLSHRPGAGRGDLDPAARAVGPREGTGASLYK